MKTLFAFLLLSSSFMIDLDKTAAINRLKQNAEIAFKNGYFLVAAKKYDSLIKHFEVKEPQIYLNLAHCYYQLKDSAQSRRYYRYVTDSVPNNQMRSIAYQQLGNMEAQTRSIPTYQKAVNYFKNALKVQPENKEARHNYEVSRKILNELQQQQQQQQQNQDQKQDKKEQNQKNEQQKSEEQKKDKKDQPQKGEQQKKDGEQEEKDKKEQQQKGDKNKKDKKDDKDGKSQEEKEADNKDAEKKDKEGDMKNAKATDEKGKGEEKEIEANELRSQRLKNMNLTPESAQMILDAMKNSETQYLQQNRRKQKRIVKPNTKDW